MSEIDAHSLHEIARYVGIPGELMARLLGVLRLIGAEPAVRELGERDQGARTMRHCDTHDLTFAVHRRCPACERDEVLRVAQAALESHESAWIGFDAHKLKPCKFCDALAAIRKTRGTP